MARNYYAVRVGRTTGIFHTWPEAKAAVDGIQGSKYKGFDTEEECEAFLALDKGPQIISAAALTPVSLEPPVVNTTSDYQIYTDGSFKSGTSGMGIVIVNTRDNTVFAELALPFTHGKASNNRAEMYALIVALQWVEENPEITAEIFSDSELCVKSLTQWCAGWQSKGWKKASGGEVLNQDLVIPAYELYLQLTKRITIRHIAAHSGHQWNERADVLAEKGRLMAVEARGVTTATSTEGQRSALAELGL